MCKNVEFTISPMCLKVLILFKRFKKNHFQWNATLPSEIKRKKARLENFDNSDSNDGKFEEEPNYKRQRLNNAFAAESEQVSIYFINVNVNFLIFFNIQDDLLNNT